MSITKNYNDKNSFCRVTFKVPKEIVKPESQVCLAGKFNDWDIKSLPMKKKKDGGFALSIDLEKGKAYQFKYIVDDNEWLNDPEADSYQNNEFNNDNSVVET